MQELLSLEVSGSRKFIEARTRLRQVCGLLGFDPLDQAKIVAVTFEFLCRAAEDGVTAVLQLLLDESSLCVRICDGETVLDSFAAGLPSKTALLDADDLSWSIRRLEEMDPRPSVFEELRRHNQDLLAALTLLQQASRSDVGTLRFSERRAA